VNGQEPPPVPKIVYYVASSLDGYIAGPDDDISRFALEGEVVERYQSDLKAFETVVMGRRTYEFGYRYGLSPGQPAYPHMKHHVFSDSLHFDSPAESVQIENRSIDRVREIRDGSPTDVYLCGGGQFAGWLLEHHLVDVLKVKLNPIVLGGGTRLFGSTTAQASGDLIEQEAFRGGIQILTYQLAC